MLILKRDIDESVSIFDKDGRLICEVTVVHKTRSYVHLGFDADPDIKIVRNELINKEDNDAI